MARGKEGYRGFLRSRYKRTWAGMEALNFPFIRHEPPALFRWVSKRGEVFYRDYPQQGTQQ